MIRVLTPIAIALFFIGFPPFHRLRSPEVVLSLKRLTYRVLSAQPFPHALDGDQISAAHAGVAKRVVGCNLRAEERSGLGGLELIRMSSSLRFSLPALIGQEVFIAP